MLTRDFQLKLDYGLHARPAAMLVKAACRFDASVRLVHRGRAVDAKSILGVLSLGIQNGDKIRIEVEGSDGAEALEALAALFREGFEEADPVRATGSGPSGELALARETAGAP